LNPYYYNRIYNNIKIYIIPEYKEKIMSGSKTGNLSIPITKLKEPGYIDVTKNFRT
jgi:hypothetical protein